MSGTSLDAIDAVLMDFSSGNQLIASYTNSLDLDTQHEIRALNTVQSNELTRTLILGKQLALAFSNTVNGLLQQEKISPKDIIAIGSHGQTIRHAPNGTLGYSLQIGDPSTIAENTGITVVADFRNRDIAAGGQGAPLVPAFHQAVFSSGHENRAIVNIGGMANATLLIKNQPTYGFDTGPGNVLMNQWILQKQGQLYDANGAWAASGKVNKPLLHKMLQEPYFQLPPPKSTGRELFDSHWLGQFSLADIHAEDIQATLLELSAMSICDALPTTIDRIYLCGGGAYNLQLKQRIATLSQKPVDTTASLGIDPGWVEAAAFAWLAKQTLHHASGSLSHVTGAKGPRILGGIYFK
jgi:anhydro-N-acetylmuramic acid kinase